MIPEPTPPASNTVTQLVPLSESSLALVGTLLTVPITTAEGESNITSSESEATAGGVLLTIPGPSVTQSLLRQDGQAGNQGDDGEETDESINDPMGTKQEPAAAPSQASSIWMRYLLGLDNAEEPQPAKPPLAAGDGPSALLAPQSPGDLDLEIARHSRRLDVAEAVDQALLSLGFDDADGDGATLPVPWTSDQRAPENSEMSDAPGVDLLIPELPRAQRIDLSLSLVLVAVGASRFTSCIRPSRQQPGPSAASDRRPDRPSAPRRRIRESRLQR
jgi:hypothetical protein